MGIYDLLSGVSVLPENVVPAAAGDSAGDRHRGSGGVMGTLQASVTDCGLQAL